MLVSGSENQTKFNEWNLKMMVSKFGISKFIPGDSIRNVTKRTIPKRWVGHVEPTPKRSGEFTGPLLKVTISSQNCQVPFFFSVAPFDFNGGWFFFETPFFLHEIVVDRIPIKSGL